MVDIFTMIISIVIMSKHPIMIRDGAGPNEFQCHFKILMAGCVL